MPRFLRIGMAVAALAVGGLVATAAPVGTKFTYQGALKRDGQPLDGFADLTFEVYDAPVAGTRLGITSLGSQPVTDGLFQVTIDFGPGPFSNGEARWVQVIVNGTALTPRQELNAAPFSLATRGMNVSASGNVGFGTSAPADRAEIAGTGSVALRVTSSNGLAGINLYSDGTGQCSVYSPTGTNDLRLRTLSADHLTVSASGNIGIGTTSPGQKLDVRGAISTQDGIHTDANYAPLITKQWDVASAGRFLGYGRWGMFMDSQDLLIGVPGTDYSATSNIVFGGIRADSTLQDWMRIVEGGNVGIGINQPASRLHVAGALTVDHSAPLSISLLGNGEVAADTGIGHPADGVVTLRTDGSERIRVDRDGNVGIGISSPRNRLEVRDNVASDPVVYVENSYTGTGYSYGISCTARSTQGVALRGDGHVGVYGSTDDVNGLGLFGDAYGAGSVGGYLRSYGDGGKGVHGAAYAASGMTYGVYGEADSPQGYGVYSVGRFAATGTKSFQIDHPLDPENKMLNHYCAEGPEPLNIYSGTAVLDPDGASWIDLPAYFEALNRDFRYLLTPIGSAMPNLHVAAEVSGNRFRIAGGAAGQRVSWQVSATRNDAWIRANGAPVEQDKPADWRGKYVAPAAFGKPIESGVQAPRARPIAPTSEPIGMPAN